MRIVSNAEPDVLNSTDTGNIVLAVQSYNIAEERPHLPGYFLYVMILRLCNHLTGNTQSSILLLQALFSAFGAGLIFLLLRKFFDRKTSLIVAVLITTNPLVWYFGSISEIYSFDLFFSLLFVLAGTNKRYNCFLPGIFALGIGVRQSSGIILFPLYVYFWWQYIQYIKGTHNYRFLLTVNAAGLLLFLSWFIPMLNSTGGICEYLELMHTNNPVPPTDILRNTLQMLTMSIWFIVPLVLIQIMNIIKKEKNEFQQGLKPIILFWLIPAIITFMFVHYTRGYWLIAIGALSIVFATVSKMRYVKLFLIIWIVIQSGYFLFMPYILDSAEIFYTPKARTVSRSKVFIARFLSQNALTLGHIREQDKMVKSIIEYIKRDRDNYKYILIAPSVPVYTRILQAVCPEHRFAELNRIEQDTWFLYSDLKQTKLTGRLELINNALIIGLKPLTELLGSDLINKKHQVGNLVFYTVCEDKSAELSAIYNKYFQKR
jgi:hypothetical protein